MEVMTPLMRQLKKQFPSLFDWWEEHKLRALGFKERDIEIIHELFGRDLLHTGIIVLLAFTHGDFYPVSTMAPIFGITEDKMKKVLSDLSGRQIVYSERWWHPTQGIEFYFADKDLLLTSVREYKLALAKRKISNVFQSEYRLLIFVSSVMNKKLENLEAERNIARVAIEDVGFARPWLFEETPASSERLSDLLLKKVERSDLFIIILGMHITDNVILEYQAALKSGVPHLIFLKGGVNRAEKTEEFIKQINIKYKEFWNLNDLREQITASLIDEVLRDFKRKNKT